MHRDLLGLLDCLLHLVMLLFSCISREDGELVEFNVVHEGDPGTDANSFVGLAAHSNPWILCVNFIHNPIPLRLCLTNDKAMGQLVSLLGLRNSNVFLGLEGFLEICKLFLASFSVAILLSGNSKRGIISFLTAKKATKASLTSAAVPFCSTRCRTAMMWMSYSLLLPVA
jgi:hypothetical protein